MSRKNQTEYASVRCTEKMQVYLHNAGYECEVVGEPISPFALIEWICSSPEMH